MSSPTRPLCALVLLFFSTLRLVAADAASGASADFKIATTRHDLEGLGYYFRTLVTAGTNQFAFIVPRGYFVRADEAKREIRAVEVDDKCSMTVRLFSTPTNGVDEATGQLKAEVFRELLLQRFNTARITETMTLNGGGRGGPGFDFTWKNDADLTMQSRIAYLPTPAGVLEFFLLTSAADAREFRYALNSLMLTLRVGEKGKIALPQLSNKL